MANQQVKFDTVDCGGNNTIVVTKNTASLKSGELVEFTNQLDGDPEATLQFFILGPNKVTPINGFCKNNPGADFKIAGTGNGKKDCQVTASTGTYEYTIAAPGHTTLDPVIIVEPSFMLPLPTWPIIAFVLGAGAMKVYQMVTRK